jgi:hypothetical protein
MIGAQMAMQKQPESRYVVPHCRGTNRAIRAVIGLLVRTNHSSFYDMIHVSVSQHQLRKNARLPKMLESIRVWPERKSFPRFLYG